MKLCGAIDLHSNNNVTVLLHGFPSLFLSPTGRGENRWQAAEGSYDNSPELRAES